MNKKIILYIITILIIILLFSLISKFSFFKLIYWKEAIISPYGYLILFLVETIFTATIFFPLAADPLVFFAGSLMDPLKVGIITGIAASIGECVSYFVGRSGNYFIKEKKLKKVKNWFKRRGFILLPIFAFTPLPCDLIGITAGILKYDFKKFFLGMLIGKIPRTILLAYAGYYGINIAIKYFGHLF